MKVMQRTTLNAETVCSQDVWFPDMEESWRGWTKAEQQQMKWKEKGSQDGCYKSMTDGTPCITLGRKGEGGA